MTITGTDVGELLNGTTGADEIDGLEGNDTLVGGTGNDTLTGGAGNDVFVIVPGDGHDEVTDFDNGVDRIDVSAYHLTHVSEITVGYVVGGTQLTLGSDVVTLVGVYAGDIDESDFIGITGGTPTTGNDLITGTPDNDTIDALAGDDKLSGSGGDDSLFGNLGNDSIEGNLGNDTIDAGDGNDTVDGGDGNDLVHLGSGDDTYDVLTLGNDTVFAEDGNDYLWGGPGNDSFDGGAGDDSVRGYGGTDTLTGGPGHDTFGEDIFDINGDTLTDFGSEDIIDLFNVNFTTTGITAVPFAGGVKLHLDINGDGTTDGSIVVLGDFPGIFSATPYVYTYDSGYQEIETVIRYGAVTTGTPTVGDDSVIGTDGNDTIDGLAGNDTIDASKGDDSVAGGDGNDVIDAGPGNDTVTGGSGSDLVHLGSGDDSFVDYLSLGNDSIFGDNGADFIITGAGNDSIDGGIGNDALFFSEGDDTLTGGYGDDYFIGYLSDVNGDVISDFGYYDTIILYDVSLSTSRISTATITGGTELRFDIDGDGTTDAAIGLLGTYSDSFSATVYSYQENGTEHFMSYVTYDVAVSMSPTGGDDELWAGTNDDSIDGLAGNDTILASDGNDSVEGGDGNDSIDAGTGNDAVDGGTGNDTIDAGDGNDVVYGGDGNDLIHLGAGDDTYDDPSLDSDTVLGDDGDDFIWGGYANDSLNGGAGDDTVRGYQGADTLTGGLGRDTFGEYLAYIGGDTITDFGPDDNILFPNVNFTTANISTTPFAGGIELHLDTDGNGTTDGAITLLGSFTEAFTAIPFSFNDGNGHETVGTFITYGSGGGITPTNGDDSLTGTSGGNILIGGAGDDTLNGDAGNDLLIGDDGIDTAVINDLRRAATITAVGDSHSVESADGTDTIDKSTEILSFVDGQLYFGSDNAAAEVDRLYLTTLDRGPDAFGLAYWTGAVEGGMALLDLANSFLASPEWQAKYGALGNGDFVTALYNNVLGRDPDQGGFDYWKGLLDGGSLSRPQLVLNFSESPEFKQNTSGDIADGLWSIDDDAAFVLRAYKVGLDRDPDAGGLAYWTEALHSGTTRQDIADAFAGAPEFTQTYGTLTNQQFVEQMYLNALDRAGDTPGVEYWTAYLDGGAPRGTMITLFAESQELIVKTESLVADGAFFV